VFAKRQAQGLERNIPQGPNDISIHFPGFFFERKYLQTHQLTKAQ
jgi:hypothetical protein